MAFNPPLTTKNWRGARPTSCKASGVGKAIEQFNKVYKDAKQIKDPSGLSAASDATTGLLKCLGDAKGKIKPKDGEAGKKATALIASWTKELNSYQDALDKQNQLLIAAEMEVLGKQRKGAMEKIDRTISIRTAALDQAKTEVKKYRDWAKQMEQFTTSMTKQVKAAETAKSKSDMMQNSVAINTAARFKDKGDKTLAALEKHYKEMFKEGGIMKQSRSDGSGFDELMTMDPPEAKRLRDVSGKLFRDATLLTNEINELRVAVQTSASEMVTLLAEAESFSMQGVDPSKYVTDLNSITSEATEHARAFKDAKDKMEGMAKRLSENYGALKTGSSLEDVLTQIKLSYEKQFVPRLQLLNEKSKKLPLLERRINSVPKRVTDDYDDVVQAKKTATAAVDSANKNLKTLQGTAKTVGNAFKQVLQTLEKQASQKQAV
jgi:hypothetical protein